jgi:ATP-dependent Lon protease
LAELPDNIKNSIKLHFVDQMDEVLALALEGPLPTALPAAVEVLTTVPSGDLTANLPTPQ